MAQIYEDQIELIDIREKQINQIHQGVVEINQMFRDVNDMVHSQGEMVDRIDVNIDFVEQKVEQGHQNIVAAAKSQKKSRKWLWALAILGIVVLGIIILAICL